MQNTDNYGMRLPIRGVDRANVDDLNYNTNIIDGAMFDNRNISLKMYNDNGIAVYNTGDIVGQVNLSGHISAYVCLDDNVSGTWDATKWDITDLSEQIMLAKQSGGATELDELDDVDLTTPSEGQVLTYDGSDWVNADAQGGEVTKTAEGNPIELTDGSSAPLVKCVTAIQGNQDLHGYDKPWVGGAGKNKYSVLVGDDSWGNNASGTHNTGANGSLVVNCTDTTSENSGVYSDTTSVIKTNILNLGTCYVSFDIVATSSCNIKVRLGDGQNRFIDIGTTKSRINVQITPTDGVFVFYGNYNVVTLTISNVMLSTVSGTDYEPYSNICPITAYTEGEIEVSDGDGNVTTHTATFTNSIYQGNADFVGGKARATWGYIASYNGETLPGEWISSMDEYAPGTTPTTGAQVAYELASQTEETITPTNLPIKSLFGYNHIESSTGEMEIEYITQAQQPLIDLIRAEKGDTYSTSEQIIGKWIDGSTLYRRTYEITVQSPSAPYTEDISITGMVVVGIEKHYANYQYSGTWYYESGDQLNGAYLSITQKDETGTALTVSSNMGSGLDAIKLCFSISYIKTSSNNRSLAKGGNEQTEEIKEEVKEEPEELKEEPEEKVEEEKEENENQSESSTR